MQPRSIHVVISGRVQGVGFRAWVRHQAQLRGISGWVRNRRDGTVEAVFSGPADAVDAMVEACHAGPGTGYVHRVDVRVADEAEAAEADSGPFAIRSTV